MGRGKKKVKQGVSTMSRDRRWGSIMCVCKGRERRYYSEILVKDEIGPIGLLQFAIQLPTICLRYIYIYIFLPIYI